MWEAEAALARGDMRVMRQAVAEAGQYWSSDTSEYCHHQSSIADLRIEEGLVEAALVAAGAAREGEARRRTDHVAEHRVLLIAAALQGRKADAEAVFDRLLLQPLAPDSTWSVWFMIEVVHASLQAGVPPGRVRREFVDGWARPHASQDVVARHAEGLLRLAEGDTAGAVSALAAALDPIDPVLYVPTLGSLRTALAAALLITGDRVAALAAAHQAVADLALWPGWRRDRAEALVRRLEGNGARVDGELTPREREVAALIAEGLTNSQLAERLYISPKTAAVHVSNILMKLGLSSRAEVAAWAVRHGVVLQPG
jgi:DNA-binding CsgD family transcriptional regulator